MNQTLDQTLDTLCRQHGNTELACALYDCLTARKTELTTSTPTVYTRRQVDAEVAEIDHVLGGLDSVING